jgi:hypothetical protein
LVPFAAVILDKNIEIEKLMEANMVLLVRKDMDVNEHDEYELKAPS